MSKRAKTLVGVSLVVAAIGTALLVALGEDTLPGRLAVSAVQRLMPASTKPRATPSAEARATDPERVRAATPTPKVAASRQPLPAQNVPIAAYIEGLKRRAKGGDVGAACRVTFELARCNMRNDLRRMAAELKEQPSGDGVPQQARDARARQIEGLERQAASYDATCRDVPDASSENLWEYALIAAHGGNVETMVHFVAAPPGLDNRHLPGQLEGWIAWRDNAATFVTRAVDAGDPAAVELAGHLHMVPRMGYQVLPRDPVRGLAHYYALERFATPAYRTMLGNSIAAFSERMNLTEAQLKEAMALSVEIEAKISRGGRAVDPVDFREGSGSFKDASHCE